MLNLQINKYAFAWTTAFIVGICCIMYRPVLSFWAFSTIATLIIALKNEKTTKLYIIISIFAIAIYAPYIATKSSHFSFGNDKYLYIEFMRYLTTSNFFTAIQSQPELVSFILLKISAEVFGINNFSFLAIFIISISLIFVSVYRITPRAGLLFITLFLASSVYLNLLGNTLRQGLAFGFILLAISQTNFKYSILSFILASLSHFSALFLAPFILIRKYIERLSLSSIILSHFFLYIIGFAIKEIFESANFSWAYLQKKRDLYINYESSESGAAIITFIASLLFIILTRTKTLNRILPALTNSKTESDAELKLFSLSIYTSFLLTLLIHIFEIFSRMYLYYLPIATLYICAYTIRRKNPYIRLSIVSILSIYAIYSSFKNLNFFPWFYCGEASLYIAESIPSITLCK